MPKRYAPLLVLALLLIVSYAHSAPKGAVTLNETQLIYVEEVACGLLKDKWVPGRVLSNGKFISISSERANVVKKARKASGSKQKKLLKKARALKAKAKSLQPVCDAAISASASTPVPTPSLTPTPSPPAGLGVIPISSFWTLEGAAIYAGDGEFIGFFSRNSFASGSIANEYGPYGSNYGFKSVFNRYGSYGSPYGVFSAFNDYCLDPPILVVNRTAVAYLTTNKFRTPRIDSYDMAYWVDRLDDAP